MNEYLKLVAKAQEQRIMLTKKQIKNIRDLYRDVAKDLGKRSKKANKDSLSERWLLDYQKQFKKDIKELNKIFKKDIEYSILESAKYATNIQTDFFNLMDVKYKLNSKETFSNMFSRIPQQALKELISGDFYKDGKGLSERLWFHEKEANANFDYIIQKGLLEKKSTYELAKDLSDYVNPEVKKDWDFKSIYPGVGNKKIEYNSFRLAVTSISHAYQLSMQRSCKANPFVEGIEWHTSNSHRGPCSICREREGKTYKTDELPLDHPNGVCYFTPVITKSLDEVGMELHGWLYGGSNNKLDDWYKEYGREFVGESNLFRNISKKDNNNDIIKEKPIKDFKYPDIKTIKEAEKWAINNLNLNKISYKDIDIGVANYVNKSMSEIYQEYPLLNGFIQEIKTDGRASAPASASISFKDGKLNTKLILSKKDLADLKSIDDMIKDCVDYKWWTPKDGVKGIIKHEMGHMIEYATTLKKYGVINKNNELSDLNNLGLAFSRIKNGELSKEIKMKALNNLNIVNTKKSIKENLSNYSNRSTLEFLAEAVSEDNPRTLAKEVVKLLKEKIKEVWK